MKTIDGLKAYSKLKMLGQNCGEIRLKGKRFTVIWGYNENGYEHVSVSCRNHNIVPTWEQMCELKDIFFYPEEMAVQIHPKASEYVHGIGGLDNVLHLWRCIDDKWEMLRNK